MFDWFLYNALEEFLFLGNRTIFKNGWIQYIVLNSQTIPNVLDLLILWKYIQISCVICFINSLVVGRVKIFILVLNIFQGTNIKTFDIKPFWKMNNYNNLYLLSGFIFDVWWRRSFLKKSTKREVKTPCHVMCCLRRLPVLISPGFTSCGVFKNICMIVFCTDNIA